MNITIITGLCGSGKTFFCKNKINVLIYDNIFSYKSNSIDYDKVNFFFDNIKNNENVYLDAFDNNLINYIKENYNVNNFHVYFYLYV